MFNFSVVKWMEIVNQAAKTDAMWWIELQKNNVRLYLSCNFLMFLPCEVYYPMKSVGWSLLGGFCRIS